MRYYLDMIQSFSCEETKSIFRRSGSKKLPQEIQRVAVRKLAMLNAAADLRDLEAPPGNRLEMLKGKRQGQYSIRINDQWRLCFRWVDGNPREVEIVDYHGESKR